MRSLVGTILAPLALAITRPVYAAFRSFAFFFTSFGYVASVDLRNSIRSSSASSRLRTLPHLRGLAGNLRSHQASRKLFSVGPVIHLASPAPRNAFRSSSAWETMMTSSPVERLGMENLRFHQFSINALSSLTVFSPGLGVPSDDSQRARACQRAFLLSFSARVRARQQFASHRVLERVLIYVIEVSAIMQADRLQSRHGTRLAVQVGRIDADVINVGLVSGAVFCVKPKTLREVCHGDPFLGSGFLLFGLVLPGYGG